MLYLKKRCLNSVQELFKIKPEYVINSKQQFNMINLIIGSFIYFNYYLFSKSIFRKIIYILPSKFIWYYHYPITLLAYKLAENDLKLDDKDH